jgi:hypothetical protein
MTEEGIRSMVKELKLPKEALGFVIAQADKTKAEIVRVVASELRSFLESAKVREDLVRLLTQLTFEVNAEVKIKPRGEGQPMFEPQIRTRIERAPAKKPRPRGARPVRGGSRARPCRRRADSLRPAGSPDGRLRRGRTRGPLRAPGEEA